MHAPVGPYDLYGSAPEHGIYGAGGFLPDNGNRRPTTSLDTIFHGYLRTVLGAYKSTPIHLLHSEAGIPPLHLYLAYRRAVFLLRPDY